MLAVSLPCLLYPISNHLELKFLDHTSNVSHGGVQHIRGFLVRDFCRIYKHFTRFSPFSYGSMVVVVHYFALCFVGCLPRKVLRHVNTGRKQTPRLHCVFSIPSDPFLRIFIHQLLKTPFPAMQNFTPHHVRPHTQLQWLTTVWEM